ARPRRRRSTRAAGATWSARSPKRSGRPASWSAASAAWSSESLPAPRRRRGWERPSGAEATSTDPAQPRREIEEEPMNEKRDRTGTTEPSFDDEDAPHPEVARIRRKVRSTGRDGRVRSKTIAPKRLTRDEKRLSELLVYPDDVERPSTREACTQMHRPCPF